jgi:hypothetical protein
MQIVDESEHTEMAASIREIYTGGEPFADDLGAGIRVSTCLLLRTTTTTDRLSSTPVITDSRDP